MPVAWLFPIIFYSVASRRVSISNQALAFSSARGENSTDDPEAFCDPELDVANRRVLFFGGTFDPPTTAHLHIAKTALAQPGIDCVWLSPMFHPEYKPDKSDVQLRYSMLSMSFGADSVKMKMSRAYEQSYKDGNLVQQSDYFAYLWLEENYPQTNFDMMVGADSLTRDGPYTVEGWRDILKLVVKKHNRILVLARGDSDTTEYENMLLESGEIKSSPFVHLRDIDMSGFSEVSSSGIRALLQEAKDGDIDPSLQAKLSTAGSSAALLDYLKQHPKVVLKYSRGR